MTRKAADVLFAVVLATLLFSTTVLATGTGDALVQTRSLGAAVVVQIKTEVNKVVFRQLI